MTEVAAPTARPPIERRDLHFDIPACDPRRWHPRGAHVAHFFNGLSIFFPEGERFFISSVRTLQDHAADPVLRTQINGFIGQEAMHGREHTAYNEWLAQAGYPIAELEDGVRERIAEARRRLPPLGQLAATMALEHLTAIMADVVLRDGRVLAGADPSLSALWRWHAIEETEHKAVAYDLYRAIVRKPVRGYLLRCLVMLRSSLQFWADAIRHHRTLLRHDGLLRDWRGWLKFAWFQFGSPGTMRRTFLAYLHYFVPGFHPWKRDNRRYVESWKAAYAQSGTPPA